KAYELITGRNGMGGGDIKFMAFVGAFLGPFGVMDTILIGSVAGSVIGIAWALAQRRPNPLKESIPFGPFLVLGALTHYFMGGPVWLRLMSAT
ncbi:MAG: A24 family peptidase, partial [Bdellovibrionota bacterium]